MDSTHKPLAEKVRPRKLTEFVGQNHLVGPKGIVSRMIKNGQIFSFMLWGPPGVGKTTLARLIAAHTKADFIEFSAVTAKKSDVQAVVKTAREKMAAFQQKTILFMD
ncbi:AAA family ATPase, partial [Patescibacteria group bacterium]|nr:AAA family ATPase [Patescibacteria group bacterium]